MQILVNHNQRTIDHDLQVPFQHLHQQSKHVKLQFNNTHGQIVLWHISVEKNRLERKLVQVPNLNLKVQLL